MDQGLEPRRGSLAYTLNFTKSRWAWEFLRRNRAYQNDHERHRDGALSVRKADDGTVLLKLRRPEPAAEQWGLHFFASPRRNGVEAPVFWTPAVHRRVLHVHVECCPESSAPMSKDDRILDILRYCCARTHFTDAQENEHVLIAAQGRVVQIACTGVSLLNDPVRLKFVVEGIDDLHTKMDDFRDFENLYRRHLPGTSPGESRQTAGRFRDMLIAIDVSQEGGNYRDIAAALYGKERADAEFADAGRVTKNKIIRLTKKGLSLVEGDYRKLLK